MTSQQQRAADVMTLATHERANLADFLETLTPQQWDAPRDIPTTGCEPRCGWRCSLVDDVSAQPV